MGGYVRRALERIADEIAQYSPKHTRTIARFEDSQIKAAELRRALGQSQDLNDQYRNELSASEGRANALDEKLSNVEGDLRTLRAEEVNLRGRVADLEAVRRSYILSHVLGGSLNLAVSSEDAEVINLELAKLASSQNRTLSDLDDRVLGLESEIRPLEEMYARVSSAIANAMPPGYGKLDPALYIGLATKALDVLADSGTCYVVAPSKGDPLFLGRSNELIRTGLEEEILKQVLTSPKKGASFSEGNVLASLKFVDSSLAGDVYCVVVGRPHSTIMNGLLGLIGRRPNRKLKEQSGEEDPSLE